jgi:AcrR family transcriptional regulator
MTIAQGARRTQAERRAATRGAILDAAIRLLCERGYALTTTVTVAAAAGISRGAMLYHFPNKRSLIFAVTEEAMDRNHAFFEREGAAIGDPWDRYAALPDLRWQLALQPHGIALMEIMVGARSDPAVRDGYPEFQQRLNAKQSRRLRQRATDAGLPLTEEDAAISRAIVFAIRGMAIEKQLNPDFDVERILNVLRRLKVDAMEATAKMVDERLRLRRTG